MLIGFFAGPGALPLRLAALLVSGSVAFAAERGSVAGRVRDSSGAVVADAAVSILDASQAVVASTRTDAEGRFGLRDLVPGSYLLVAAFPGLEERRHAVTVARRALEVDLVLEPRGVREEVTVTASPGLVESVESVPQQVNVIGEREIGERAKAVVAQAAAEEVGVHLQRTSPTIAGIYVRGLTGSKVNVFVDGVRYSTASARGGINTFLDLVEADTLQGIEVLRGPNSAQYGSDALGGSVQFLTRAPTLSADGRRFQGSLGTALSSADLGFGSHASASYSAATFGALATLAGRRVNTLRPGGGRDSHNAVTRFLGLPSDLVVDGRLPDTAFTQYGGQLKTLWAPSSASRVLLSYARSQQDGGKRYDQLLGGDGNLVADLRNLMVDRLSAKLDLLGPGGFDRVTIGYSFNTQREERVNQGGNGNPRASVNHEYERTSVHGAQLSASRLLGRHSVVLGGDAYLERLKAPSFGFSPVTGLSSVRRGRVPDRSRYLSGGVFLQDAFEAIPGKVKLTGGLRFSAASYRARAGDSPLVNGKPLWPDDSLDVSDVAFRAGIVLTPREGLTFSGHVGRGFRAPHITDLGTLGLTGSGFEVAAPDVAGLGATIGTTADRRAVSTGRPLAQLRPETSLSYEVAARYYTRRVDTDLALFLNDVSHNIAKQALVLPPGAVGARLGDEVIASQDPSGVVFVPVSTSPVLVRANFDDARLLGIEHTLEVDLGAGWSVSTVFTYVRAKDRRTGLPPNLEGGTPAPDGYLKVRYQRAGGRFWLEPYLHAAARQDRLSSLDLEDRRTGAIRSRQSIAAFFGNGARARGLVGPGPDGIPGTADDVLLATGETLAKIQDRVLGPGIDAAPLYTAVPAYVTLNVRGGVRFGTRHEVLIELENIGDRNYRGISWGVDAPGRGVYVRYTARF